MTPVDHAFMVLQFRGQRPNIDNFSHFYKVPLLLLFSLFHLFGLTPLCLLVTLQIRFTLKLIWNVIEDQIILNLINLVNTTLAEGIYF